MCACACVCVHVCACVCVHVSVHVVIRLSHPSHSLTLFTSAVQRLWEDNVARPPHWTAHSRQCAGERVGGGSTDSLAPLECVFVYV